MLPERYQTHLTTQLTKTQYLMISVLIQLLQNYRWVRLEELANKFPCLILFESRRRKLQRFLELPSLTLEAIWLPIFSAWLRQRYSSHEVLYIAIDRTRWRSINLIMISLIVEKRAIPIYFELLDHIGNSDLETQQALLGRVLPLFKEYKKVILGDREFCSVDLAKWLKEQGKTYFCLRLKRNEYIEIKKDVWVQLQKVGLAPGVSLYFQGVKLTKTKGFSEANIACKWKRKYRGWTAEEGWFILTNLDNLAQALASYEKRFGIEEMFRDFKSGGYNLEETMVQEKRLMTLILLITLAYSQATVSGEIIKNSGVAKYVGRVREKGRTERRHSDFYLGLHGQAWVKSLQLFAQETQELMNLSRHKCANYRRGMMAASLIASAF
ncbi:MAG: IS4 family transposase [Microcystaceae cyanobacterium]